MPRTVNNRWREWQLGLEAEGKSIEVYFESAIFPSFLYNNIGFEVEISQT